MNIRLNKVIRELNVGIDTIVAYLHENGVEVKADPNEKIDDEQYAILKKKFGADKDLRKEADKLLSGYQASKVKNAKEKKAVAAPKPQVIKTEVPQSMRPGMKVVGHIDLDSPAPKLCKRLRLRSRKISHLWRIRSLLNKTMWLPKNRRCNCES